MDTSIIKKFIEAVNTHNLSKMAELLDAGHHFTDAHNTSIAGKEEALTGWKGYFEWFPDYKIEAEKIIADGDTFAIFGFAEGTFQTTVQHNGKGHWRLPACWKAVVKNNLITLWQVYADTKIPFEIIGKYTAPAGSGKITGLGGAFFKSKDPKALCEWYDKHLGTDMAKYQYQAFAWRDRANKEHVGSTSFAIFKESSNYFEPSTAPFMFNFRVNNLDSFLARLKAEGVTVFDKTESADYGKFGWILDGDGNKVELWEPLNEQLSDE